MSAPKRISRATHVASSGQRRIAVTSGEISSAIRAAVSPPAGALPAPSGAANAESGGVVVARSWAPQSASTTIMSSSTFVAAYWKTVPSATSAARATSLIEVRSKPRSSNSACAAARMRARFSAFARSRLPSAAEGASSVSSRVSMRPL